MALRDDEKTALGLVADVLPDVLRGIADLTDERDVLDRAAGFVEVVGTHHITAILLDRIAAARTDTVDVDDGGLRVVDEQGPNAPGIIET